MRLNRILIQYIFDLKKNLLKNELEDFLSLNIVKVINVLFFDNKKDDVSIQVLDQEDNSLYINFKIINGQLAYINQDI